jgi:hypothetical protein
MLLALETGEVLVEKSPDVKVYPSSTTKIMTALLLLETKGLEGEVTVGAEVNGFGDTSSLMGLKQNETVTVSDLFYGLMLCSGNDAANAIAVYVAGSLEGFSAMMNERAKSLAWRTPTLYTPTGCFLNPDRAKPRKTWKTPQNHCVRYGKRRWRWPSIRDKGCGPMNSYMLAHEHALGGTQDSTVAQA